MLSSSNFYWYIPTDAEEEFPRCNWSYKEWVSKCVITFAPAVKHVWEQANDPTNVKTRDIDNTDYDKIFRFVNMSQEYTIKLRSHLLACGCMIGISGHEIWEGLSVAKVLVRDGKLRQEGDFDQMVQRAASIVFQWNRVSANTQINSFITAFLTSHNKSYQMSTFMRQVEPLQNLPAIDDEKVHATRVDSDGWNAIKWGQLQGSTLLVSPLPLYLSLKLPLGNKQHGIVYNKDNDTAKDCSVAVCNTENICVLYTQPEIDSIIDFNNQKKVPQTQMIELGDITKKVVCYSILLFVAIILALLIVFSNCCFVYISNTIHTE